MKVTYLGHQTWLLSEKNTNLLIDPLLTESFGTSKDLQFRVYPPRKININKIPNISGIFITNEHLDHFHIPSLRLLDKSIPVYLGRMMPDCVKEIIKNLGFTLYEVCNAQVVHINELKIKFYIGKKGMPFWEKRVYQLYVINNKNYGVFVQSDTMVSDFFIERVNNGIEPSPSVFIATNNSQATSVDRFSAFDNLLPLPNLLKTGLPGLTILEDVLVQYTKDFFNISYILLSGGGYIIDNKEAKPFLFSDIEIVNNYLKQLSVGLVAKYLYPGEIMNITDDKVNVDVVNWITLDAEKYKYYQRKSKDENCKGLPSLNAPIFESQSKENLIEIESNKELIDSELKNMSSSLLLSALGKLLIATNEYLDGGLGPYRFVISLKINKNKSIKYQFNINTASFELEHNSNSDLQIKYPYGIELFLNDFIAILQGKIQIWELATANMRQWYLGDKMDSPIAFLYMYFSEQIRPDLAHKVYKNLNEE